MIAPLKKASTLKEVHALFDPVRYLSTPAELEYFYVDRKSGIREEMKILLDESLEDKRPVHIFFTGHRGSGKSTEINKLRLELDNQFFVVPVSFRNRPDVDYVDLLLKAANTLFKTATDVEVIRRAPKQIASEFWEMLVHFVENKVYGDYQLAFSEIEKTQWNSKEVTIKLNALAFEFEAKFEAEPESRKNFKENGGLLLAEVIDKINMLADKISDVYQQPVLFIFEDADKIDLKNAEEIFYKHCNTLATLRACAIYVIDIGLIYNVEFQTAKASFAESLCLHNIKLLSRDNQTIPQNIKLLERMIDNRAESHCFTEVAKGLLISSSGGLIRSLITLIRNATRRAIVEGSEKVEKNHVEQAIKRHRGDFIALLDENHYVTLKQKHGSKALDNNSTTQYLLQSLALLEYDNGERWCDVHPVIFPEVEKRTKPTEVENSEHD